MDANAVLGPVDPQLGNHPAASIVKVLESKELKDIDDETILLADIARKALRQVKHTVTRLLQEGGMGAEEADELAQTLSQGGMTHDYAITLDEAAALGLRVESEVPRAVYDLMALYPQARGHRPSSVQYLPQPYRSRSSTRSLGPM